MSKPEENLAVTVVDGIADTAPALAPETAPGDAFDGAQTQALGAADGLVDATRPGSFTGLAFDHFRMDRPLGAGGMGTVYLAEDTSLARNVAVKVLPQRFAGRPDLRARFIREAQAQAKLQSPHVTHIYFIGQTPPDAKDRVSLYFAMELIDGGSLDDLIDAGDLLEPERARTLMVQVCRGLQAAFEADIIHRDIKPSNLLLDARGDIKIADFGLAKPIGEGDIRLTQGNLAMGSPYYMSPEQAFEGESVDHRSDMYSLGCAFYHCLTGDPPFDGASAFAIVNQHAGNDIPDVCEKRPDVPRALADVIARLMSKKQSDRYDTWPEAEAALEDAAPKAVPFASFWARGAALGMDLVLAGVLVGLVGWLGLLAHLVYVSVAHARLGQTLGKRLMHLRVRDADDPRAEIGYGRSVVRTIISLWLPFFVGTVIALTQGTTELIDTIEHVDTTEPAALQSWLVAAAVSNGFLSLLYAAGLAMANFHPRSLAVHDIVTGTEVVYELSDKLAR